MCSKTKRNVVDVVSGGLYRPAKKHSATAGGVVGGAAAGGAAGGMVGGPWGALIGAAVGAVAGGAMARAGEINANKQQKEARLINRNAIAAAAKQEQAAAAARPKTPEAVDAGASLANARRLRGIQSTFLAGRNEQGGDKLGA